MAAGGRDVANLCWKLAAVVRGELPAAVLDSYEVERKPHVREVTRRAVLVGRVITQCRPAVTKVRDLLFRGAGRVPFVRRLLVKSGWVPEPRYRHGFLATTRSRATGRKIPQPWVLDGDGTRRRLDEITGGRWTVLATRAAPATPGWSAVPRLTVLPAGTSPTPGGVVDVDGVLSTWLRTHRVDVVALRPDSFVYAAGSPLAPPRPACASPNP